MIWHIRILIEILQTYSELPLSVSPNDFSICHACRINSIETPFSISITLFTWKFICYRRWINPTRNYNKFNPPSPPPSSTIHYIFHKNHHHYFTLWQFISITIGEEKTKAAKFYFIYQRARACVYTHMRWIRESFVR